MLDVILYTTHCPKCNVLETKLKEKNISYTEIDDVNVMIEKGFELMPMLEVNRIIYGFKDAVDWINKR